MHRIAALLCRCLLPLAVSLMPLGAQAAAPRKVAFTETVHGLVLHDEYRWMEDTANQAELTEWLKAEGREASAQLRSLSGRAQFRREVDKAMAARAHLSLLQSAAGTDVYLRSVDADPMPRLFVRAKGRERLIADPTTVFGKTAAFDNLQLSPDGKTVAVHVTLAGKEVGSVHFFDTRTAREVGRPIERIWGEFGISFLAGGRVGYTQMGDRPAGEDPLQGMSLYVRKLSGGTPQPVLGAAAGDGLLPPEDFPVLNAYGTSRFVLGSGTGARRISRYFVATRDALIAGKPAWRALADLSDQIGAAMLRGDRLYQISLKGNGAGVLQRRDIERDGTPGPVSTLVEGSEDLILQDVATTLDGVYLLGLRNGIARLFFSPQAEDHFTELSLPLQGSIGNYGLLPTQDEKAVQFTLEDWLEARRWYRAQAGAVSGTGLGDPTWQGVRDFISEQVQVTSADGTRVPLSIVRRRGTPPAGGTPVIVEGYGSYGISTATPFYNPAAIPWLVRGGSLAYCGTRGGSERGESWHEAGRGLNKPRAQEDFIACARWLSEHGIAPHRGPVALGSSAAGTLIPAAVLRAPEAFAGMVLDVGVLNATRLAQSPNGANQFVEMGNPSDPTAFRGLLAMDAYQLLASATAMPASLLSIGLNDNRVAPWHSAKFVARARDRLPATRILLQVDEDAGHGIGTGEEAARESLADFMTFAWDAETRAAP